MAGHGLPAFDTAPNCRHIDAQAHSLLLVGTMTQRKGTRSMYDLLIRTLSTLEQWLTESIGEFGSGRTIQRIGSPTSRPWNTITTFALTSVVTSPVKRPADF